MLVPGVSGSEIRSARLLQGSDTEMTATQAFQHASSALYRSILTQLPDSVVVLDSQGTVFEYNDSARDVLFDGQTACAGLLLTDVVAPSWSLLLEAIERGLSEHQFSVAGDSGSAGIYRMRRVSVSSAEFEGDILIIENVSDQQALRESVKDAEHFLVGLAEHLPVAVFRTTPGEKGRFIGVNQTFVSMFGYESIEEVLVTSPIQHYASVDTRKQFSNQLLKEGRVLDLEVALRVKMVRLFPVR